MELDPFAGHLFVFGNRRRQTGSKSCTGIGTDSRYGQAAGGRHYAMPFEDDGERRREITAQELGIVERYRSEPGEAAQAIPKKHRRSRINTGPPSLFRWLSETFRS